MNNNPSSPSTPTVVITGASTGIGKACALRLCERGWRVFAGVRKENDAEALLRESGDNLLPLFLDVTDEENIRVAAATVMEAVGETGLSGLVNNAGIAVSGPLESLPISEIRRQFEINVIGQLAVTQALMPLIRQGHGRIVLMSSIAGRSAIPFTGPYCASKFALEALGDSLRLELRPWKIPVSIIEPGAIETPIWEKSTRSAQETVNGFPPEALELYGEILQRFSQNVKKIASKSAPVDIVVKAVEHALTATRPRARYTMPFDAKLRLILESLPTTWRDSILARAMGIQ